MKFAGRAPGRSQAGPPGAMGLRLNAASIAVPSGDRPGGPAFSGGATGRGACQNPLLPVPLVTVMPPVLLMPPCAAPLTATFCTVMLPPDLIWMP
jgi:hypothetical protein